MKQLKDILYKVPLVEVKGSTFVDITMVSNNSSKVEGGALFVAIRGAGTDGHSYIDGAISKGAIAVLCEEYPETINPNITYVKTTDTSYALGIAACNFYDNPSHKLNLIGITGTNGKTTTVTLLYQLFSKLGYSCGLISTIENKINDSIIPSTHTTPDAIQLNALLKKMYDEGCAYVFMEVSSHAVIQNRIAGLKFKGAIFSNLTHDHLDYHKTFENYRNAKKKFFDDLENDAFALVNKDDKNGMFMVQNTSAHIYTYALQNLADIHCKIMETHINGTLIQVDGKEVWIKLIGKFNVSNMTVVYSVAKILNQDINKTLQFLSELESARGRFQVYNYNNITGIVDYAHTPDALENVLKTIREIKQDNQKVITIVGCGGNRDATKRPIMANIATELSDKVILTSDNPRDEDPKLILQDMEKGILITKKKKCLTITDREEAIQTAIASAEQGDIVLIAGKGHETYQEIKGVKYPFNDYEKLQHYLKKLKTV